MENALEKLPRAQATVMPIRQGIGLARYDAMCSAIAESVSVDEVKEIRDRARAFEMYAKQAKNQDAERKVAEIRIRAERRAGQLLTEMKEKGERRAQGQPKEMSGAATLPDLGITRDQSSQWQQLAEIPEPEFEAQLAAPGPKPTAEAMLKKKTSAPSGVPVTPRSKSSEQPHSLSRGRVWAAQETKHFTKEFLRLLRSYEKAHDRVESLVIVRNDGAPVNIEIVPIKESAD